MEFLTFNAGGSNL